MGTARVQGELWGAKARDWAEAQEPAWQPVYAALMNSIGIHPGARLLDIGCGAGGALVAAREVGAEVAALDASDALAAIARERLPGAEIAVGEMEALPFEDEAFDVVTAFNALQFADDRQRAFREARRVCKTGGTVATLVWGPVEDCELLSGVLPHVMALLPQPSSGMSSPVAFSQPGVIEGLMSGAGLSVIRSGSLSHAFIYPDLATAVRAVASAAPIVRAERHAGESVVRQTLVQALQRFVDTEGHIRLDNRFIWVTARR